jgi:hypothetical protein
MKKRTRFAFAGTLCAIGVLVLGLWNEQHNVNKAWEYEQKCVAANPSAAWQVDSSSDCTNWRLYDGAASKSEQWPWVLAGVILAAAFVPRFWYFFLHRAAEIGSAFKGNPPE